MNKRKQTVFKFRTVVSEGSSYFVLFFCFKLSIPYHTIILASSDQLETIFFIHAQPLTRFYRQSLKRECSRKMKGGIGLRRKISAFDRF